jgi:hypothetical protein
MPPPSPKTKKQNSCLLVIFVIKINKNQTSAPKYSCFVSFSGCSRQKKKTTGFSDHRRKKKEKKRTLIAHKPFFGILQNSPYFEGKKSHFAIFRQ